MKCCEFIEQVMKSYYLQKSYGSTLTIYDRAIDYILGEDMSVAVYRKNQDFKVILDDGTVTVSTDSSFTIHPKQ